MKIKILWILGLLAALSFANYETVVSPSDGLGYSIKGLERSINVFVTDIIGSTPEKIQLRLQIQEELQLERVKELQLNKQENVASIERLNNRYALEVQNKLNDVKPHEEDVVNAMMQYHLTVLNQIREQVPEQAKAGIDIAIQSAQQHTGQDRAATSQASTIINQQR